MSKKTIIYSQKYPKQDWEELDDELPNSTEEELRASAKKLIEEFENNVVFKLNQKKLENKNRFIGLAKTISQEFKIDAEIYEEEYAICAELCLEYTSINNWLGQFLGRLMALSDSIDFCNKSNGLGLNFSYNIYDMYYNDRLIKF